MADTIEIVEGVATVVEVAGPTGPQGPAGATGATGSAGAAGQGVPVGGTTGQVLRKASSTNYDTEWATGGGGGVSSWNDLTDKPATFPPSSHTHELAALSATGAAADDILASDGDGTASWRTLSTFIGESVGPADIGAASVSHTHGNITDDGKVGSTSGLPLKTGAAGVIEAGSFGTSAGTFCQGNDSRLSDSREWSASTIDQAEAEAGTATTRRAFTALRVFQAIAAWWAGSSAKTKLDGIASGATANATDAQLRDRSTHTGTQAANTITGLAAIATSGSASDLASNPTLVGDVVINGSSSGVSGSLKVGNTTGSFSRDVEINLTGVVLRNAGSSGTTTIARGSGGTSNYTLTPPSASGTIALQGAITTSGLTQSTARILGRTSSSTGAVEEIQIGSGLSLLAGQLSATGSGGGTKTYAVFTATDNQPPATSFATLDTRNSSNSIAVLDFDDASTESAVFVGIMPEGASLGSGLIVNLDFMATAATSGNVRWSVAFERCNTDLNADSFDTATAATVATSGTSGIVTAGSITCTAIDGITAGDLFRLRVQRLGADAADTMTGDAELIAVEVRSAA
jgi:hypothetical protein